MTAYDVFLVCSAQLPARQQLQVHATIAARVFCATVSEYGKTLENGPDVKNTICHRCARRHSRMDRWAREPVARTRQFSGSDYDANRNHASASRSSGSRRRSKAAGGLLSEGTSANDEEDELRAQASSETDLHDRKHGVLLTRGKRRKLSHVAAIGPAYPLSAYQCDDASPDLATESEAILDLLEAHEIPVVQSDGTADYLSLELNVFSIYRPTSQGRERHRGELVGLDRLMRHGDGADHYLLDAVVSYGDREHRIQGVPFSTLAVDGYGDLESFDLSSLCIQSRIARRYGIWYRLGRASREYERFYRPFLWLAQFTKVFVEYLLASDDEVNLRHFQAAGPFLRWLYSQYARSDAFKRWLNDAPRDHRTAVAANVGFLWKECASIDSNRLCKHPVWGEVDPLALKAIRAEPNVETRTVVTPFAYGFFRQMYFARQLKPVPIKSLAVLERVRRRKEHLHLTPLGTPGQHQRSGLIPKTLPHGGNEPFDPSSVQAGDAVSVVPDSKGPWKSVHPWYAYVQCTRPSIRGTVLDVLWLYHPSDTTLGAAYYPFANELFLSDNCNCGRDAINAAKILGKVTVKWYERDPGSSDELFVRQKFRTVPEDDDYSFESLKPSDFKCSCTSNREQNAWHDCAGQYVLGDTVLVRVPVCQVEDEGEASDDEVTNSDSDASRKTVGSNRDIRLEPAQIVDFNHRTETVTLRHFLRASNYNLSARPNELLTTCSTFKVGATSIVRRCNIRYYDREIVPVPYNLDGSCDFFYIVGAPEEAPGFPQMVQGFDPSLSRKKLPGLGIFCGGGNLDRGLEDGGMVDFKYAVDYNEQALHSYRASSRNDDAQYFLGSVDDYLALALEGSEKANVAQVNAISVLAAGSPCPGFSMLQIDKLSEQSLKNASMVASVVAFVDFYNPKYLFFENVIAMTTGHGRSKDENVFSQLLAALVALGYQVQQFLMDSWSYGSAQQRSRVFIVATAPGLPMLSHPPHSHDHPTYVHFSKRSLGQSSNGLRFGRRRDHHTPFPCFTPAQACYDLPEIGDSQPQLCSKFPDHRTVTEEGFDSRTKMRMIPVRPGGMGLVQAYHAGHITGGEPWEYIKKLRKLQLAPKSLTYARAYADRLVPTLTTACHVPNGISGRHLHWAEHRPSTVQEYRRIQGYLDHEVLVGTPSQQMRMIGNSVDRKVPLALGIALREAVDRAAEHPSHVNAWRDGVTMRSPEPSKLAGRGLDGDISQSSS